MAELYDHTQEVAAVTDPAAAEFARDMTDEKLVEAFRAANIIVAQSMAGIEEYPAYTVEVADLRSATLGDELGRRSRAKK